MKRYIIDLRDFAPIISSKEVGDRIYEMIMEKDPKNNEVEINLEGIVSMATFCAKQIFGKLYTSLSPSVFSKNIIIKNASSDVKPIIQLGIRFAKDKLDYSILE